MMRALASPLRLMRRFRRDEDGAVVVDYIPVFAVLIVFVLFTFEVGVAYFLSLRSYKAAQLGARVAVVLPAIHEGVPQTNGRTNPSGRFGEPCFNPIEGGTDRCFADGDLPAAWICAGADLSGECDEAGFDLILQDMRRTFGPLQREAVTITYVYRQLGETGGPFIPEVNVAIVAQDYELSLFGLAYTEGGPTRFGAVSASAFGENTSQLVTPVSGGGTGASPGS